MKRLTINFFLFALFIISLSACNSEKEINKNAFENSNKLTVERIHTSGQRELILEISDTNAIHNIVSFIDIDTEAKIDCSFQLKLTFQKFEGDNIEAFTNLNGECNNIAYTYESQFFSQRISDEGVNYLRLMTGL